MENNQYGMPQCKCGGKPKLTYDSDFRMRIKCTKCGIHTIRTLSRFTAEEEWEKLCK